MDFQNPQIPECSFTLLTCKINPKSNFLPLDEFTNENSNVLKPINHLSINRFRRPHHDESKYKRNHYREEQSEYSKESNPHYISHIQEEYKQKIRSKQHSIYLGQNQQNTGLQGFQNRNEVIGMNQNFHENGFQYFTENPKNEYFEEFQQDQQNNTFYRTTLKKKSKNFDKHLEGRKSLKNYKSKPNLHQIKSTSNNELDPQTIKSAYSPNPYRRRNFESCNDATILYGSPRLDDHRQSKNNQAKYSQEPKGSNFLSSSGLSYEPRSCYRNQIEDGMLSHSQIYKNTISSNNKPFQKKNYNAFSPVNYGQQLTRQNSQNVFDELNIRNRKRIHTEQNFLMKSGQQEALNKSIYRSAIIKYPNQIKENNNYVRGDHLSQNNFKGYCNQGFRILNQGRTPQTQKVSIIIPQPIPQESSLLENSYNISNTQIKDSNNFGVKNSNLNQKKTRGKHNHHNYDENMKETLAQSLLKESKIPWVSSPECQSPMNPSSPIHPASPRFSKKFKTLINISCKQIEQSLNDEKTSSNHVSIVEDSMFCSANSSVEGSQITQSKNEGSNIYRTIKKLTSKNLPLELLKPAEME